MTDKLYTQKEVDELQRLTQAAALKEVARVIGLRICCAHNTPDIHRSCQVLSNTVNEILALSDQPLLAQHDDKVLINFLNEFGMSIHQVCPDELKQHDDKLRAEAAAVMEKAVETIELMIEHRQTCALHDDKYCDCPASDVVRAVRKLIPTDYADAPDTWFVMRNQRKEEGDFR